MAIQTRLEDMQVGDKIIARYSSMLTGVYGEFSELGTYPESGQMIPINVSVLSGPPDGGFYFIYVGEDFKGRKILVADRNVQAGMSWNELNEKGVATKEGLPLIGLKKGYFINVRLLTGGVSDASKGSSEWDRYISSALVGTSSTALWNWHNIYSWASTSNLADSRVLRGNTSYTLWTYAPTAWNNPLAGFRPVFVAEKVLEPKIKKYLVAKDNAILRYSVNLVSGEKEWIALPETVLTKELFLTHGMTDLSSIPESAWAELGTDFEILCFKEEASPLQVKVTTETLYDAPNKRYLGTGKIKADEVDLPVGATAFVIQTMAENATFTVTYDGVDLGVKEPGVKHPIIGGKKLEVFAEMTDGQVDAVALLWL